jgi:hypothetical protein
VCIPPTTTFARAAAAEALVREVAADSARAAPPTEFADVFEGCGLVRAGGAADTVADGRSAAGLVVPRSPDGLAVPASVVVSAPL